jgi:hypothetical protein
MNVCNLFDDDKKVSNDKDTIKTLNSITDKQVKTILELENKIVSLEKEKEILNNSIIILKKKIFDIEIENKVLSERVLELDSIKNTPVPSSVDLDDIEKKKLKVIQERLNQKRVLYGSLRSARREIVEKNKKQEIEQQV